MSTSNRRQPLWWGDTKGAVWVVVSMKERCRPAGRRQLDGLGPQRQDRRQPHHGRAQRLSGTSQRHPDRGSLLHGCYMVQARPGDQPAAGHDVPGAEVAVVEPEKAHEVWRLSGNIQKPSCS